MKTGKFAKKPKGEITPDIFVEWKKMMQLLKTPV